MGSEPQTYPLISDELRATVRFYDEAAGLYDTEVDFAGNLELRAAFRRRVVDSAAPGSTILDFGCGTAQHHASGVDVSSLPFPTRPSPAFGLPVLAEAGFVREVSIREIHRIASHVLFVGEIEREAGHTPERLAHVSAMYARWLVRRGRSQKALG
jgi:hypothetical protein